MLFFSKCCLFGIIFHAVQGNIVLQSDNQCGSNMKPKTERLSDTSDIVVYSHLSKQYYYPAKDCVVVIVGREYHQWEIVIENVDIDGHECKHTKPCCNDYLKLFNAYTVDNARLFPSIPWRGLCGSGVPTQSVLTSTQNYVTIQFNTDHLADNKRGFRLTMRQYPRRSAGNLYQAGFYGWNDGTLNELQIDWNEQEQIPGDYKPGKDSTFDPDPDGVSCYVCTDCKRDYFKSSDMGVAKQEGCHVCTKEWLQGSAQAARSCLSRSMFESKLLTLQDISSGRSVTTDFRSCKVFSRTSSAFTSSTYVNMCVCDSNNCNHAGLLQPSRYIITGFVALVAVISATLLKLL